MSKIGAKIDEAFKNTFLFPREKVVTDFLVEVLNSKYQFREDDTKIEVISVYYYALSPLSFLFALPNYDYYSPDKTSQIAELHLKDHSFKDYSYTDIEELCRKVLNENNIDYSEYLNENDDLDSNSYWENQFNLELEFLLNCWKTAKEKTRSKMLGFLESSDGSGGKYDLDNGFEVPFEIETDEYLQSNGFYFTKEA